MYHVLSQFNGLITNTFCMCLRTTSYGSVHSDQRSRAKIHEITPQLPNVTTVTLTKNGSAQRIYTEALKSVKSCWMLTDRNKLELGSRPSCSQEAHLLTRSRPQGEEEDYEVLPSRMAQPTAVVGSPMQPSPKGAARVSYSGTNRPQSQGRGGLGTPGEFAVLSGLPFGSNSGSSGSIRGFQKNLLRV